MENFIVIEFQDSINCALGVCDYPKNLPVPVIGDTVNMKDDEGIYRFGVVSKRTITVRAEFTEIKIIVKQ